jgi:hypothetical protein
MPYRGSAPLVAWRRPRRWAIAALEQASDVMEETDGPGQPIAHAYVLRLVAEFQGFVRDLHDLAIERMVDLAVPDVQYRPLMVNAATRGRSIDRGNAHLSSLTSDFQRLGLTKLGEKLTRLNVQWASPKGGGDGDGTRQKALVDLRNALAHGNQGEVDGLRASGVEDTIVWARDCLPGLDRTAHALDQAVWDHMVSIFDQEPW